MPRLLSALPLFFLLWTHLASTFADEPQYPAILVAPTDPLPAEEQLKKFHLPPGFTIQLVACEPQIHKPMNLNFDGAGRMYVTSSLEYPFPVSQAAKGRDVVSVLEDRDGDGRAERAQTIIKDLNIPIGVTPTPGGIVYYSIPSINFWEGDVEHAESQPQGWSGKQSRRLYQVFGFRDTHGMASSFARWIDGWIYCCHGFSNESTVIDSDGKKLSMQSGNTFRIRADGSRIEQVTHGQVNPFGLCFDPLGNEFTADCHTLPVYQLLRGAWYPSFGKPHDGLGFGPAMIGHNHGSTGIAGVVYYAADHFPPEYRDTVFIGNPVTGKVNHDRLELHGSSFKAIEQPDFIACDDPWFRPVDLKLAPDGSLYILDFYNKIIGHYEVPLKHPGRDRFRGRIWRVVYTGADGRAAPPRPMPDLARLPIEQLVERLGDPNLTVRVLATEELVSRQERPTAEQLLPSDPGEKGAWHRAHGLWILERTASGGLSGDQIERLAGDPAPIVRVHLIKALAERPDWTTGRIDLAALVRGKLSDSDAFVRRAAADALGRHPQPESVEPLLLLWGAAPADDTHLIHVVRMALRDHLRAPGMYAAVAPQAPSNAERAARLADVSLGVHSPEAAEYLFAWLPNGEKGSEGLAEFVRETARWLPEAKVPELCVWAENRGQESLPLSHDLALAIHRSAQERKLTLPESFVTGATRTGAALLAADDKPLVQSGIDLAREMRLQSLFAQLAALAAPAAKFAELRAGAIDACVVNDGERSVPLLSEILGGAAEAAPLRQKAAGALASINSEAARQELVKHLRLASDRLALEIAVGLAARKPGAEQLLAEISAGKASPRLLQEAAVKDSLRRANVPDLDERLAKLTVGLPPADERIKQLLAARRDGFRDARPDVQSGKAVFQKTCAACHRVSGVGGKVGPDLDGVGLRGVERLLEDVLDPSRNVDQAFRSTVLATTDGQTVSGLLLRTEGAVLVLADNQGKEIRVPESDVDERALTALSPMPGNVADLLPEADFYHLLAYLLEQRQAPSGKDATKPAE